MLVHKRYFSVVWILTGLFHITWSQPPHLGNLLIKKAEASEETALDSAISFTLQAMDWGSKQEDHYAYIRYQQFLISYYNEQGKFAEVDSLAAVNWGLAREHLSPLDTPHSEVYAYAAGNQANSFMENGKYPEATELYPRAFEIFERLDQNGYLDSVNIKDLSFYYQNMGISFRNMGDYTEAIRYYKKISELYKRLSYTEPNFFYNNYFNIGRAYALLNIPDSAISFYEKSRSALSLERDPSEVQLVSFDIYRRKAEAFHRMGELDSALANAQKSLTLLQPNEAPYIKSSTYEILGSILSSMGKWQEAEPYLLKSIKVLSEGESSFATYEKEHTALKSLGTFYESQKRYSDALPYYERAFSLYNPQVSPAELTPNILPFKYLKLEVLESLIRCRRKLPDTHTFSQNQEILQLARGLIQALRSSFQAEESKLDLAKLAHNIFEEGLLMLSQETEGPYIVEKAFEYIESNKAMLLYESLRDQKAKLGLPTELRSKEKRYKRDLAFYEKGLFDEQNSEDTDQILIDSLKANLFFTEQQYKRFQDTLESTFPNYYQAKYQYDLATLTEIQGKLSSEEAFIQFFLGDTHLFVMGVHPQEIVFESIPFTDSLFSSLQQYQRLLSDVESSDPIGQVKRYIHTAHFLKEQLLSPVLNQIPPGVSHLILSPDGILSYLPVEAFLEDQPKADLKYSNLPYLIRRYSISYTHSATHWLTQQEPKTTLPSQNWLGYSPSFEEEQIIQYQEPLALNRIRTRDGFLQLPFAQEEISQIADMVGGRSLFREKALESDFHRQAPRYRVLHLATHGFVEKKRPMDSRLIFAPESDSSFDGRLFAHEIYNMELLADLVVLSACNTGIGKLEKGEGIMSLSRAFFHAGANSLVMSLWSVADKSSSDLMVGFYKGLTAGMSKDLALQQAKINYIQNQKLALKAHPFYWAGFVLKGNSEPIPIQPSFLFWKKGLIVWIVLGLIAVYIARRKKNTT